MLGGNRFVLYLYSGRRRHGDFTYWANLLSAECSSGLCYWVITLDVMYVADWDLLDPKVQELWRQHMLMGRIAGLMVAPPCESWCRARWRTVFDAADHGPRPVRDSERPWGLWHVSVRQRRQVRVANSLLQVALSFMALALRVVSTLQSRQRASCRPSGVCGVSESWRAQRHLVKQHDFGGISPKPTHLLIVNGDQAAVFQEERIPVSRRLPKQNLIGKDSSGRWRTAAAKEYPPALTAPCCGCAPHHVRRMPLLPLMRRSLMLVPRQLRPLWALILQGNRPEFTLLEQSHRLVA